jgi:hypothetical protein
MMNTETHRQGYRMYGCCRPMMRHGSHYCGVMFGIMLVLIGAIWLSANAGWFNPELFWPTTFLAMGSVIVLLSIARERKYRTDQTQYIERSNHDNVPSKN